jgi:hypothetical protein
MASMAVSVFIIFSPLQAAILAADAGATARITAAIVAAPSNLVIMLLSSPV